MEKILWVSCLKEDGLFGKIPVEILKNIIGIANEIEYHQNCKWHFYKTFVGKLQDKMLDQEISQNSNLDSTTIIEIANSSEINNKYIENTEKALENNVWGSPTFIYNNEPFWGQDRIEFLERAIQNN